MKILECNPYIRYVNNYAPAYSYVEKERIIYDHEFMYIMSGSAVMNYGGQQYHLKKGDLFYLSPGVKNNIEVRAEWNLRMHCIHFDWMPPEEEYDFTAEEFYMHSILSENHVEKERALRKRPNPEPEDFVFAVYSDKLSYELFSSLFEKCYREYSIGSQYASMRLKALFMEIISRLMETGEEGRVGGEMVHPRIMQAIEYIKENYNKHLMVEELAKKYELSPKYFGKLFSRATGKSVNAFVLDLRIFAAKEMLIGTEIGMENIATQIGFADAFYFSNCFKNVEGIAPSHYRALMQKKLQE